MSGWGGDPLDAAWLVEALIASTLLMGFVLIVRKAAQRAVGAQLAYWLWALPALRMAMPPLPAAWREQTIAPIAAASETVRVLMVPMTATADPASAPFPWLMIVAGAWLAGAALFFAWHGAAHFRYVREILAPPARHERLDDGTTLVESDAATGPVAFGVLKRFVAVPRDFTARYDDDERRLALAHELGHHARGDLIANWVALAVLAAHWFNPVAWAAYRKFRADQEMANDARVLAALPVMERHAYACAILKAAHGRAVTAACHLHTIEDLKGRLKMLKANRISRRVAVAGATGIAALTVAGLGLTASGAAAEKIRTVAAVQVPVLAAQVAPVAPVADPAPPAPPADPAAPMARHKKIVIVKDGKTETYEGAEADAFLAAHPGFAQHAMTGDRRQHRIVIRKKDGKTETYEGSEAEAYLKAHPDMAPPLPPLAPLPPVPGAAPTPPAFTMFSSDGGKTVVRAVRRSGPGANAYAFVGPEVIEGDCGDKAKGFVRHEKGKNGQPRMVICKVQIERFAADQAKMGQMHARFGLAQALRGIETGRTAIMTNRNLTDEQRQQALSGLDAAKAGIEQQMREGQVD